VTEQRSGIQRCDLVRGFVRTTGAVLAAAAWKRSAKAVRRWTTKTTSRGGRCRRRCGRGVARPHPTKSKAHGREERSRAAVGDEAQREI